MPPQSFNTLLSSSQDRGQQSCARRLVPTYCMIPQNSLWRPELGTLTMWLLCQVVLRAQLEQKDAGKSSPDTACPAALGHLSSCFPQLSPSTGCCWSWLGTADAWSRCCSGTRHYPRHLCPTGKRVCYDFEDCMCCVNECGETGTSGNQWIGTWQTPSISVAFVLKSWMWALHLCNVDGCILAAHIPTQSHKNYMLYFVILIETKV